MKPKRLSEEQNIAILKQGESGVKVEELCRQHGMSPGTFYAWRNKFGDMEVSEAKRLRGLEEENRKLRSLVADLSLDNQMLKAVNAKKWRALENVVQRCDGFRTNTMLTSDVLVLLLTVRELHDVT